MWILLIIRLESQQTIQEDHQRVHDDVAAAQRGGKCVQIPSWTVHSRATTGPYTVPVQPIGPRHDTRRPTSNHVPHHAESRQAVYTSALHGTVVLPKPWPDVHYRQSQVQYPQQQVGYPQSGPLIMMPGGQSSRNAEPIPPFFSSQSQCVPGYQESHKMYFQMASQLKSSAYASGNSELVTVKASLVYVRPGKTSPNMVDVSCKEPSHCAFRI